MAHDITDKVRKLLAKAERASTSEEAEAFTAKAADLIYKHQIDEADLLAKGEQTTDRLGNTTVTLRGYAKQQAILLNQVASGFAVKAVRTSTGAAENRMVLIGWESDLEAVQALYASLWLQAQREASREHKRHSWENGRTFRTSFYLGFSVEVGKRLAAQKYRTSNEREKTPGTEIALFNREQAVSTEFRRQYPRTGSASASYTSKTAFGSGSAAGQRADIGGTRLGGGRAAVTR